MSADPLSVAELGLLRNIFFRYPQICKVMIFGSRAKGTHRPHSDVDLAVWGKVEELQLEEMAAELDELPLPYRFDVLAFDSITSAPLREHIQRVGLTIYLAERDSLSISRVLPTKTAAQRRSPASST